MKDPRTLIKPMPVDSVFDDECWCCPETQIVLPTGTVVIPVGKNFMGHIVEVMGGEFDGQRYAVRPGWRTRYAS